MIGRAGALLVDIAIDTVPRGYRIVARPGAVTRRAISLLGEDIDALEEAWEIAGTGTAGRAVKLQAPGPITLAAQLELRRRSPGASPIRGAVRDLTASLAEGMAVHAAEVARRLAHPVVVQFDEPLLPAALAGRLTGVTSSDSGASGGRGPGRRTVRCVRGRRRATSRCTAARRTFRGRCCSAAQSAAVSVDVATLTAADLDGIGEFVESGRTVLLGVVPVTAPAKRPVVEEIATAAAADHRPARLPPQGVSGADRHHAGLRAGRGHPGVGPDRDRAVPEGRRWLRGGSRGDLTKRNQKIARQSCLR